MATTWTHAGKTYTDLLRLTPAQYAEVLSELSHASTSGPLTNRRPHARHPCVGVAALLLEVERNAHEVGLYIVRPCDISRTGVAFLHGGFVHAGSRVLISLVTLDRQLIEIRGKVARCRHVKNLIHEIGVAFDEPFASERFKAPDSNAKSAGQFKAVMDKKVPVGST